MVIDFAMYPFLAYFYHTVIPRYVGAEWSWFLSSRFRVCFSFSFLSVCP